MTPALSPEEVRPVRAAAQLCCKTQQLRGGMSDKSPLSDIDDPKADFT